VDITVGKRREKGYRGWWISLKDENILGKASNISLKHSYNKCKHLQSFTAWILRRAQKYQDHLISDQPLL
jgi:hypothetical protein